MRETAIFSARGARIFALASLSYSIALAAPVVFTWDPSKSLPALAGAGSSFTADTIDVKTYLSAIVQPNGVSAFKQILQVTGFELNGQPVSSPGINSSYGLYFNISGLTQFAGGAPSYSNLELSLAADPGFNNGTLSATVPAGLAFSNGTGGDFVLGSGSLIFASLGLDPAGVRHAHYIETFAPASGGAAFLGGVSPMLDIVLTTPGPNFAAIPQLDGTTVQLANGGTGQVTFVATPEPTPIALIGAGFVALLVFGRQRRMRGALHSR